MRRLMLINHAGERSNGTLKASLPRYLNPCFTKCLRASTLCSERTSMYCSSYSKPESITRRTPACCGHLAISWSLNLPRGGLIIAGSLTFSPSAPALQAAGGRLPFQLDSQPFGLSLNRFDRGPKCCGSFIQGGRVRCHLN